MTADRRPVPGDLDKMIAPAPEETQMISPAPDTAPPALTGRAVLPKEPVRWTCEDTPGRIDRCLHSSGVAPLGWRDE